MIRPPGTSIKRIVIRKTNSLSINQDLEVKTNCFEKHISDEPLHVNPVLGRCPTDHNKGPSQAQSLPMGNVSYAALLLVKTPVSLVFFSSSITDSSRLKQ